MAEEIEEEILEEGEEEIPEELEEEEEIDEEEEETLEEEEEDDFDPENVQNLLDPNEYPEHLQPALKKMQGIFTKKMQESKDKIHLAELMEQNPKALMEILAEKTGVSLSDGEVKDKGGDDKKELSETEKWIRNIVADMLGKSSQDVQRSLAEMRSAQQVDYLAKTYPDWTLYEDTMAAMVKKHPTLSGDLDTLYKMAKNTEESAKQTIANSKKQTKVSTKTATKRSEKKTPRPSTPREAIEQAINKLYPDQ